jgi:hypothetical protein
VFDRLISEIKEKDQVEVGSVELFAKDGDFSSLFEMGTLKPDFREHICHLSLRLSNQKLPEYNGIPYLPHLINLFSSSKP